MMSVLLVGRWALCCSITYIYIIIATELFFLFGGNGQIWHNFPVAHPRQKRRFCFKAAHIFHRSYPNRTHRFSSLRNIDRCVCVSLKEDLVMELIEPIVSFAVK